MKTLKEIFKQDIEEQILVAVDLIKLKNHWAKRTGNVIFSKAIRKVLINKNTFKTGMVNLTQIEQGFERNILLSRVITRSK